MLCSNNQLFCKMTSKTKNCDEESILVHHEQQDVCSTRLSYRQGRKLTAVKVYTINDESKHLLVFGVPSLNLRQETKALFSKFGKLLQFNITKYPAEQFTETYHAFFERIQSARIAKRMLDTKNYYGGSLHVCYAPELETLEETKEKIIQRQKDVIYRLRNLNKEEIKNKTKLNLEHQKQSNLKETLSVNLDLEKRNIVNEIQEPISDDNVKLNMGDINTIQVSGQIKRRKQEVVIEKHFQPTFTKDKVEVIDCTSTEKDTVTNINESLNYNNFGNEVIRKIPEKAVNRIKFFVGNKNT